MRQMLWAMCLILLPAAAAAQQPPCRSFYQLGEIVPPACRDTQRTGLPPYQRWGEGHGAAQSDPTRARAPAPRPEWHHFRGYNSAYGFGR